jgi:transposase
VAQARLPVRKIREVLRLKAAGLSDRQIAKSVGSARSTVQACVARAREVGLAWPLSEELDEAALEAALYRRQAPVTGR